MMKKDINILLILFFSFFLSLLNAKEIRVNLKNYFALGDDESAAAEYLFAWPTNVCTDSNNNIYISDRNMSKIRVFDEKGNFLNYISRKGQGPGEIQEVNCMTVDHDDNLIVVDRLNHRFTRFSNMGKDFITYRIPINTPIDPWFISPLGKDCYVIYFHVRSNNKYRVQPSDRVLHVFNNNFTSLYKSFARADEIWDINDAFLRTRVGKSRSNLFVINPSKIIISPEFYDGKICLYDQKSSEWKLKIIKGERVKNRSYKLLDFSDYPDYKFPGGTITASGPGYKFLAQMLNISKGIFALSDGKIVHFVWSRNKKKSELGIELFEHDGKYIGYDLIGSAEKENHDLANEFFTFKPLWKDKNDYFYYRMTKNGFPVIIKAKLDFQIQDGRN